MRIPDRITDEQLAAINSYAYCPNSLEWRRAGTRGMMISALNELQHLREKLLVLVECKGNDTCLPCPLLDQCTAMPNRERIETCGKQWLAYLGLPEPEVPR